MENRNQKMIGYVGIDLSKRSMEVVRLTGEEKPKQAKFKTANKHLPALVSWLNKDDVVAMEAGELAFFINRYLDKHVGCKIILLNAGDLATIYQSLKKTDKEDALKLARLIKRIPDNELPVVSLPSEKEEQARRLSSENGFDKASRTRLINRLHSIFVREGITEVSKAELKNKTTRDKLISELNESNQKEATRLIEQIELLEKQIKETGEEERKVLNANAKQTRIYMSMPGIGPKAAVALSGYLSDGSRFSHRKQFAYYSGLVPRVDCSGEKNRYGRIIKRGCRPIRAVIIQSAWALVRSGKGGDLSSKYKDLMVRRGKNRAIVAVARKMLEVLYTMVKKGRVYDSVDDEFIDKKLKHYGLLVA